MIWILIGISAAALAAIATAGTLLRRWLNYYSKGSVGLRLGVRTDQVHFQELPPAACAEEDDGNGVNSKEDDSKREHRERVDTEEQQRLEVDPSHPKERREAFRTEVARRIEESRSVEQARDAARSAERAKLLDEAISAIEAGTAERARLAEISKMLDLLSETETGSHDEPPTAGPSQDFDDILAEGQQKRSYKIRFPWRFPRRITEQGKRAAYRAVKDLLGFEIIEDQISGDLVSGHETPPRTSDDHRYPAMRVFSQDTNREISAGDEGFVVGRKYRLEVSIDTQVFGVPSDTAVPAVPEIPVAGPVKLTVTLESDPEDDFFINDGIRELTLPRDGPSPEPATFIVRPRRNTTTDNDLLQLRVRIYYKLNLLSAFDLIASAAYREAPKGPGSLRLKHNQISGDFHGLPEVRERLINIEVRKSDGTYTLMIRFDPKLSHDGSGFFWTRARIEEEELHSHLDTLRSALATFVQSSQYACFENTVEGPEGYFERDFAILEDGGTGLWSLLFRKSALSGMMQIGDLLMTVPEDSLIQIALDESAEDFVIPWNLLKDPGGLWGLRFRIDQLIIAAQRLSGLKDSMKPGPPLDFGLLLGTLAQGKKHRENIEQLFKRAEVSLTRETVITTRDEAYAYLSSCDSHVIYFFSHGIDAGAKPGKDPWLELQAGRLFLLKLMLQEIHLNKSPIVVLNACESGQVIPDRSVSFVHFFLDRGARAVVATECVMRPGFAAIFAEALFERMFCGEELGTAIVALRREYLKRRNPLALAYTVYGRASTRFEPALLAKLAS